MQLQITGDEPIYRQIRDQIGQAIAGGKLRPGERLPTVRALADTLGVNVNTVARAYRELERAGVLVNRPGRGSFVAVNDHLVGERRSHLQAILGRAVLEALSLGYSTAEVEAAFGLGLARWRDEHDHPLVVASASRNLRVAGSHDLVLDLLASRLGRLTPPVGLDVATVGSLGGLIALGRGDADVAACHLFDAETGEYNVPFVRRLLPGWRVVVVALASREQGLIVRKDNPRGIARLADLTRPDVAFVNRQAGSGTRLLLDHQLERTGIDRSAIRGYQREVSTHLRVAATVAEGEADVGLGMLAAARAFDLDFVPLWRERFDLVIPREGYDAPAVARLLVELRAPEFHEVVRELGGYGVERTGQVVAET